MCGATSGQYEAQAGQQQNFQNLMDQAKQEFGDSSQIFGDLTSSFAPVVAAGPNQNGYSPAELSALNSAAITNTGQAYKNASQAAGERIAASGGGNAVLPSGTVAQEQGNIATAGASQTASALNNIDIQNAAVGRQNWLSAAGILSGAPSVFGAATAGGSAATSAGEGSMSGANAISQANSLLGYIGIGAQTAGQIGQGVESYYANQD